MSSRLNIVHQALEQREESLSPLASRSKSSRGRIRPEDPSPVRLEFQRDRDRIIHCNSFRRLKHKTQVFIAPIGDHYVTRLTHTLEVSQIARTISRALNINEDLTEAISLGHDLGHTPFGHIGEDMLNELYPGGFRHNEQSLRIVDFLENNGQGLNLTWEVRDGIVNHSKTRVIDVMGENWGKAGTLEGEVCKIADVVAYINHDIDDAIRAGFITEDDLPAPDIRLLGHSRSERINTMVCDVVENSWLVRGETRSSDAAIQMSGPVRKATSELHQFLYRKVYDASSAQPDAEDARRTVRFLYQFFKTHPESLPPEYLAYPDDPERHIVDHIASMTDQYALRKALELGLTAGS
jgi:dGTPase